MKNMVLLIDTNVLIDYLLKREPFFEDANKIMTFCAKPEVQGFVAFHSLPNLWYILRRTPEAERRVMLKELCTVLTVANADHDAVLAAIDAADFHDFEDCLQDKCAASVGADYIITRNTNDFLHAETKAITPADFCRMIEN